MGESSSRFNNLFHFALFSLPSIGGRSAAVDDDEVEEEA
jgi:hypothetical protein